MRRKIYRSAVVAAIIGCVAMALLCWYAVGVIEKSNMADALENRANQLCERLDLSRFEYDSAFDNMDVVCKEKARTLALLISKEPEMLEDETWLEEMRLMSDADVICIADETGECRYTAGSGDIPQEIHSEFMGALNSKSFSEHKVYSSGNSLKIAVGCSRLDKKGIIQMEFSPDKNGMMSAITDSSNIFADVSFMKTGSIAVINKDTGKYMYHTNNEMVGTEPMNDLVKDLTDAEGDTIDAVAGGQNVLLSYRQSNMGTVMVYVPYSEVYETRDDTTLWVVLAAVVVSVILTLAVRNRILKMTGKKK